MLPGTESENLHTDQDTWPVYQKAPPYLQIRIVNGNRIVDGTPSCELGTPVKTAAQGQEDGIFARWRWDGINLEATVDPLGFYSLFVYQKDDMLAISPSILQLIALGADTQPDERALGVFHLLGLFINDDTPFKYIRTLPPNGKLQWQNGKTTIEGHRPSPRPQLISREEAVDGIIDRFRSSMSKLIAAWDGDWVLPLSGGRDSRHILLEMEHQGVLPKTCLTFQQPLAGLSDEAQAARAICREVGVPHTVLGQPINRPRNLVRTLALTSLCSDEHSQFMPLHDFLKGSSAAVLDGIGGGVLTNAMAAGDELIECTDKGNFEGIAAHFMRGHAAVICKGENISLSGRPAKDADISAEVQSYVAQTLASHSDAPCVYQAFWFWHRTRREIAFVSSSMAATASAVIGPYLDRSFVDFCLSLPFSITRDHQLHADAINRAYPQYRKVPFAEGYTSAPTRRGHTLSKLGTAVAGVRTILPLRPARPAHEIKSYINGSPRFYRHPGEVRQFHALMLERLDAAKARRLLQLTRDYGNRVEANLISDVFDPGSTGHA